MDETLVHQPPEEKRLNPFAFPAETDVRFSLLILAVITLALDATYLVLPLINEITGNQSLDAAGLAARFAAITGESLTESSRLLDLVYPLGTVISQCSVMSLFVIIVAGLTQAIYRGHPRRIRRARKLVPLSAEKDPRLAGEIAALAGKAQVPIPAIEIGSGAGPADGQVFGAGRNTVMRLGSGMALVLRKAPQIFRATILHELAHIANGDVRRAYLSQSLWVSTVAVIFVPMGLFHAVNYVVGLVESFLGLASGETPDLWFLLENTVRFFWLMLQLAGLLGLYALIRGSLLRAREVYADWRAALWGAAEGLTAIFQRSRESGRRTWFALWRLHPTAAERLRLLQNPRRLFSIPTDLPLMVGALIGGAASGVLLLSTLAMLGFGGIMVLVADLIKNFGFVGAFTGLLVSILGVVVMPLLIIVPQWMLASATSQSLGLEVQREAVAALALNERKGLSGVFTLLGPAILFAVGLEVGVLIAPVSFFSDVLALIGYDGSVFLSFLSIAILSVIWIVVVSLVIWLWLIWAWHMSQRLLGSHAGESPPDSRRKFLAWWMSLLLWLALTPLMMVQSAIWFEVAPNALFTPSVVLVASVIGLSAAAFSAAIGWIVTEFRRGGSITCPACQSKTKQRHAVGRGCEHCGADLAAWIWV